MLKIYQETDKAYDAKIDNIGIGIKTFVCPSNSKTEKIEEFDRKKFGIEKFEFREICNQVG